MANTWLLYAAHRAFILSIQHVTSPHYCSIPNPLNMEINHSIYAHPNPTSVYSTPSAHAAFANRTIFQSHSARISPERYYLETDRAMEDVTIWRWAPPFVRWFRGMSHSGVVHEMNSKPKCLAILEPRLQFAGHKQCASRVVTIVLAELEAYMTPLPRRIIMDAAHNGRLCGRAPSCANIRMEN